MKRRFAILGPHTQLASPLGRKTIEKLLGAGFELGGLADPDLDFVLQMDSTEPAPHLLQLPLGVWRFGTATPGPLAFWDVFDGCYHMEVRLERLTGRPGWTIPLDRRWLRVDRCSHWRTQAMAATEMAEMLVYVATAPPSPDVQPVAFPPPVPATPSAWDRMCLLAKLAVRNVLAQMKGILFRETWKIGVIDSPVAEFTAQHLLTAVRWLPNPGANRFLADPFLWDTSEGILLMAEDFDFASQRGRIVEFRSPDASFGRPAHAAIAEDCHMSHPFLLQHEGELYCVPETHQAGAVFAWRYHNGAWKDRREMFRLPGNPAPVDPTLIEYERRWWLFCANQCDGVDSKLLLYHAASPWGPWTAHAHNPVKVDVRSSRPGGTPFVHRGQLYRPAQDCSKHYGWRLMMNRVTRLSPAEFAEETVRVFDGDRLGVNGIHTLSGNGNLSVVDGRMDRFAPQRIPHILAHKMRRLFSGPPERII